jgi:hypothetical protein
MRARREQICIADEHYLRGWCLLREQCAKIRTDASRLAAGNRNDGKRLCQILKGG